MTYRNAYKELNSRGIIDEIILSELNNGGNLMLIKVDIIHGIDYYTDFTKTSTFKEMKYWQDSRFWNTDAEKQQHRICNAICKALAEIEIAEASKQTEQLKYMISAQV